jgi:sensor histidine kinase YesM
LGVSATIQGVIMSFRHLTGVYLITDAVTFWATILLSSLIGTVAGLVLALPDIYVIHRLDRRLRWDERTLLRIIVQVSLTVLIASIISVVLTLLSEWVIGYKEPLMSVLIRNGLIFPAVNILLMTILEGWMFFRENRQNKEKAERLSHELVELRFEILKNQIDAHFMFNNLNVLSALIDGNPDKAQQFIAEFSDLYRYVLDTIDKPMVSVFQELQFIKSYFFLQQIRHGDAVMLTETIPEDMYNAYIPPLSLQTAIENAIKHNAADAVKPLKIELSYSNGYIEAKNQISLTWDSEL